MNETSIMMGKQLCMCWLKRLPTLPAALGQRSWQDTPAYVRFYKPAPILTIDISCLVHCILTCSQNTITIFTQLYLIFRKKKQKIMCNTATYVFRQMMRGFIFPLCIIIIAIGFVLLTRYENMSNATHIFLT